MPGTVMELFAGVGGFRLGLEPSGWRVGWSNQWEPATKAQHASHCYVHHFGPENHSNEDISEVLDRTHDGRDLPDHDLLVGGFPCQDYSVAKVLSHAHGIEGRKGVLWWEIHRLLVAKRPPFVLLENVDRLLKSPAKQRGRDFAVMLGCLNDLGYVAEWRVVNAADYGFPQRRRRVFVVAHHERTGLAGFSDPEDWMLRSGILARALPVKLRNGGQLLPISAFSLMGDVKEVSDSFGTGLIRSPFLTSGVMVDGKVLTAKTEAKFYGPHRTLVGVLLSAEEVPDSFFIPSEQIERWVYLKGSKRERRVAKNGFTYHYNEGPVAFPDPLDQPSRTILTGEGGPSPSRFKHVVRAADGRLRRLTPVELERLNGFPDDWTNTGMPDVRRAFMMGNALVVGLVKKVGKVLATQLGASAAPSG